MKKNIFISALIFICCSNIYAKTDINKFEPSLEEVQKWFKAWELVYKDIYKIKTMIEVDLVLFDETYVYTTSPITGKDGFSILGPSLIGKTFSWIKKSHNGKIVLPNGKESEIQVMSFASQSVEKPFFVMPLTSYWYKQNIEDHGSGLEILTTCVFLHEFAHTQQMKSLDDIGVTMEAYSKLHPLDNLSDDLMQDYYQKDSIYLKAYKLETDFFKQAALNNDKTERIELTRKALKMLKDRQNQCLEQDKRDVATIDNFFLTFEGIGQFTAFVWLINPKGGNLSIETSLKEIKTEWWSQEQGFDIILLLSKYMKPKQFSKYMFGQKLISAVDLLEKEVRE